MRDHMKLYNRLTRTLEWVTGCAGGRRDAWAEEVEARWHQWAMRGCGLVQQREDDGTPIVIETNDDE